MASINKREGLSFIQYESDGIQQNYTFNFKYISKDYIEVRVDDQNYTDFTFVNANEVRLGTAAPLGIIVTVRRVTDSLNKLVDFVDGGIITENLLDTQFDQVIDLVQEAKDVANQAIFINLETKTGDVAGVRMINVGDPVDPQDAVNLRTMDTALAVFRDDIDADIVDINNTKIDFDLKYNEIKDIEVDYNLKYDEVVQIGIDAEANKVQTGLDRVQTGLDVIESGDNADRAEASESIIQGLVDTLTPMVPQFPQVKLDVDQLLIDVPLIESDVSTLEGLQVIDSGKITALEGLQVTDSGRITDLEGLQVVDSGNITTLQGDLGLLEAAVIGTEQDILDLQNDVVFKTGVQTVDSKVLTNASIQSPSRMDVKKDTLANLVVYAATATDGQLCFATDTKEYFGVTEGVIAAIGGGGDSNNMFLNGNMESPIISMYTCGVNNTCTTTEVSGEFSSGKKALKVALASGVLSVKQEISTPAGITKQGYVRVTYRIPSAITDAQICSLVDGVEQNCIPSNQLINNGTFQVAEVPLTFGATSAGFKIKTTASYTQNVFIDNVILSTGLPNLVGLAGDTVYSAQVSNTGVISNLNKTGWISGNCVTSGGGNSYTCPLVGFATAPNCSVTNTAGTYVLASNMIVSPTSLFYTTYNSSTAGNIAASVSIICQKSGSDYANASSSAYLSTNGNFSGRTASPALTGNINVTGTVYYSRQGNWLEMYGVYTWTGAGNNMASITLPEGLVADPSFSSTQKIGSANFFNSGIQYESLSVILASSTTIGFQRDFVTGGTGSIVANDSSFPSTPTSGDVLRFLIRIPIQGWSNSNLIVGSFEGIEKCANDNECESILSGNVTSANVVTLDNPNIPFISSASWSSGILTVNFNTGYFTVTPRCWVIPVGVGTGQRMVVTSVASTGVVFNNRANDGTATATPDSANIFCKKTGVDSKPKTAKIASSIGVPTVPGITTERVDTFSVSYGTGSATTVCSASPCSYLDQIGNAVTSVTRTTTGRYVLNASKTYTKLKCNAGFSGTTNVFGQSLNCSNCNSLSFDSVVTTVGGGYSDSNGTLTCQGTY